MADYEEWDIPSVPEEELTEYANSLFWYLYFHLDVETDLKFSPKFDKTIGRAVFKVERSAFKFNNEVLDTCGLQISKLKLCQKVCSAYARTDYYKRFYYTSAFILDLMLWWRRLSGAVVDLSEGPRMWKVIFRNNFDSRFPLENGWRGLADAGTAILENPKEEFMQVPLSFMSFGITGLGSIIQKYDEGIMDKVIDALDRCRLVPLIEIHNVEEPEDSQPRKRCATPSGSLSVSGDRPDERKRRKRSNDEAPRTPDSESEPPSQSKVKLERRKRSYDEIPKDSDSDPSLPSSSKAKMGKRESRV